uniref:Uncharacterized protein n=1 Tax=viral metagenome TaxID=1070528 RepID=A0A6C0JNH9_9ZZZZ
MSSDWRTSDPLLLSLNQDTRIMNFAIGNPLLPDFFPSIVSRRMLLYSGDEMSKGSILNLQLSEPEQGGWNIFCCLGNNGTGNFSKNLEYLKQHQELQIILCLIDLGNISELTNFSSLFEESIDIIKSDWGAMYIPERIVWTLLKPPPMPEVISLGGYCIVMKHQVGEQDENLGEHLRLINERKKSYYDHNKYLGLNNFKDKMRWNCVEETNAYKCFKIIRNDSNYRYYRDNGKLAGGKKMTYKKKYKRKNIKNTKQIKKKPTQIKKKPKSKTIKMK